ncbi:Glutathione S-transferase omega-1 [Smittium mucronatum]|uniref:Glutathione S-transferase omega-1 n=1 Tax=Smittium mucronatum TaxID=133383 RepID=A0A1R0GPT8_9FUNG|nr:Glutathione S-transferase omega-1 [Smittium mucronatum]
MTATAQPVDVSNYDGLVLYYYRYCPYSQRVLVTLEETNTPYKPVEIDLLNKPEWYLKINEKGETPTLRLADGTYMTESNLISAYIDKNFSKPGETLIPQDDGALPFYKDLQVIYVVISKEAYLANQSSDMKLKQKTWDEVYPEFLKIETIFRERATGEGYAMASRYGFNDIFNQPFFTELIHLGKTLGHDVYADKNLPAFNKWYKACSARPSFIHNIPDRFQKN